MEIIYEEKTGKVVAINIYEFDVLPDGLISKIVENSDALEVRDKELYMKPDEIE